MTTNNYTWVPFIMKGVSCKLKLYGEDIIMMTAFILDF